MNLVTLTVDLDTHVVVPIEPTREQIKNACDAWIDSTSRMLLNKACASIKAGIKAAPPYQSEQVLNMVWIPVSERLPDTCWNLVYANGAINCYGFELGKWIDFFSQTNINPEDISHWMPLPAAPKGEE